MLLGIEWCRAHYVDGALPFGLRSALKIFMALADALQWVMLREGVSMVHHYLYDFITIAPQAWMFVKLTSTGFWPSAGTWVFPLL